MKKIWLTWHQRGYVIVRQIPGTDRTACFQLNRDGQPYFGKINLTDEPEVIDADLSWMATIAGLTTTHPGGPIRAPLLIDTGPGWFIAEWVDAPLLLPLEWDHGDDVAAAAVEPLAQTAAWLDSLAPARGQAQGACRSLAVPAFARLIGRIDTVLLEPQLTGMLDQVTLAQAHRVIEEHLPFIRLGLQHGDLVPWHFFALPGGRLCLFDGEHSGPRRLLHYDLAYAYTRLYTRSGAPGAARQLLLRYASLKGGTEQDLLPSLMAAFTMRALCVLRDAHTDRAQFDYMAAAQDVLERCLDRSWGALIAA